MLPLKRSKRCLRTVRATWRCAWNLSVCRISTHFLSRWSAWSKVKVSKGSGLSAKVQAKASTKKFGSLIP
jgi:hypothetical protein